MVIPTGLLKSGDVGNRGRPPTLTTPRHQGQERISLANRPLAACRHTALRVPARWKAAAKRPASVRSPANAVPELAHSRTDTAREHGLSTTVARQQSRTRAMRQPRLGPPEVASTRSLEPWEASSGNRSRRAKRPKPRTSPRCPPPDRGQAPSSHASERWLDAAVGRGFASDDAAPDCVRPEADRRVQVDEQPDGDLRGASG
jgi:hypothetical protein